MSIKLTRGVCAVARAFAALSLFAFALPAHAQFTITFDNGGDFVFPASTLPPDPNGTASVFETLNITGTVINTSGQTIVFDGSDMDDPDTIFSRFAYRQDTQVLRYSNDTQFGGPFASDPFAAFLFQNGGIAAGSSFTGVLQTARVDSSTAAGVYNRDSTVFNDPNTTVPLRFQIQARFEGDTTPFEQESPGYSITIGPTNVPETGSLMLAACALPLAVLGTVRRRRA